MYTTIDILTTYNTIIVNTAHHTILIIVIYKYIMWWYVVNISIVLFYAYIYISWQITVMEKELFDIVNITNNSL